MGKKRVRATEDLWSEHTAQYRDPHQIVSQWLLATEVDADLLRYQARGDWWEALDEAGVTLLVTREYEHLALALCVVEGRPRVSYLHMPHPSGIAVDPARRLVHLASTRNPNVIYELAPATAFLKDDGTGTLFPRSARFLPGRLYLHDLARVGPDLVGTAVGLNALVRFPAAGGFEPVWWPRCLDTPLGPRLDKNYLQLNAIATGASLSASFFTASAAVPGHRRPGQRHFPVDGRGVVFAGDSREVCATGLTRPHSLRFYRGALWVQNSGYGQLGRIVDHEFEPVLSLPGWTRGLCFHGNLAFAGTSRVIPRFRRYAPGLDVDRSECGVHVVDMKTGRVRGSLSWPRGNQIFGIEVMDRASVQGFPFSYPPPRSRRAQASLFFGVVPDNLKKPTSD